jgi:hypothetical protein
MNVTVYSLCFFLNSKNIFYREAFRKHQPNLNESIYLDFSDPILSSYIFVIFVWKSSPNMN